MKSNSEIVTEFKNLVNMTSQELSNWLETTHSKEVGQKLEGEIESIGHHSGKLIVELLNRTKTTFSEEDIHHMQRVNSYIHRHLAQKPSSDITNSRWRYSLMNWGHDPLKDNN